MDREYMRTYYRRFYENPCDLVVVESDEFKEFWMNMNDNSFKNMNNEKFEKPKTKDEAFIFLKKMSGQVTYGVTGVTIKDLYQNKEISFADTTEVHLKNLSDNDILWYIENEKDILNRCGYCIAGKASLFVDKVVGDFYTVLGVPIGKLHTKLSELGYSLSDFEIKKLK